VDFTGGLSRGWKGSGRPATSDVLNRGFENSPAMNGWAIIGGYHSAGAQSIALRVSAPPLSAPLCGKSKFPRLSPASG